PLTTGSIRLTSKALRATHPAGELLFLLSPAGRRGRAQARAGRPRPGHTPGRPPLQGAAPPSHSRGRGRRKRPTAPAPPRKRTAGRPAPPTDQSKTNGTYVNAPFCPPAYSGRGAKARVVCRDRGQSVLVPAFAQQRGDDPAQQAGGD